ncbi:MAG: hypothetical protein R3F18_15215 [Lysobacterales bacterium]|nr:hypothetical protein [Rhodanobacteraceae bacterium]
MSTKTLKLTATLAALALSGMAMAATPAPMANQARCDQLSAQFDSAKAAHATAPNLAAATASRDKGVAACKAGDFKNGTHELNVALHDLNVKPSAVKK